MNGKLKSRAAQALAPRERKVRDFDEDLQDEFWCFNPEYPVNPVKKVFFERPELLQNIYYFYRNESNCTPENKQVGR